MSLIYRVLMACVVVGILIIGAVAGFFLFVIGILIFALLGWGVRWRLMRQGSPGYRTRESDRQEQVIDVEYYEVTPKEKDSER